MDNLTAVPNEQGIEILKQKLYDKIKKFALVDDKGKVYFTGNIHSVFFDTNGVLTTTLVVPKEEHLTHWNKWVRIVTDDDKIVADVQTPPLQLVKGVGGEQVVKITVSGQAGEVVFKTDEYVTSSEIETLLVAFTGMWEMTSRTQQALISNEISKI